MRRRGRRIANPAALASTGALAPVPKNSKHKPMRSPMKRNIVRNSSFRAFAALLLLSAVAAPAYVLADMDKTESSAAMDDRVEARIKELHSKLGITADQEAKWKDVTEVMRDNAATVRPMIEARMHNESTRSAIDDLKSYAKIADAHADGIKKFASAFEPLYDSMPEAQKKIADALFRKHGHEGGHHHKAAAATGTP